MKTRRFVAQTIPLLILPVLAACDDEQPGTRHCVDKDNNIVDEKRCDGVAPDAHGTSPFFWYYMGTLNGNRMSGGYYAPRTGYYYASPAGHTYSTSGRAPSSGSWFGSGSTGKSGGSSIRGLSGGHGISVGS